MMVSCVSVLLELQTDEEQDRAPLPRPGVLGVSAPGGDPLLRGQLHLLDLLLAPHPLDLLPPPGSVLLRTRDPEAWRPVCAGGRAARVLAVV